MSKREYKLENKEARNLPESDLIQILLRCFTEHNGCEPSAAQEQGLQDAAQWVKTNMISWREVEKAIQDGTWNPAEGPRAILGPG